jgi:hypothetical protein
MPSDLSSGSSSKGAVAESFVPTRTATFAFGMVAPSSKPLDRPRFPVGCCVSPLPSPSVPGLALMPQYPVGAHPGSKPGLRMLFVTTDSFAVVAGWAADLLPHSAQNDIGVPSIPPTSGRHLLRWRSRYAGSPRATPPIPQERRTNGHDQSKKWPHSLPRGRWPDSGNSPSVEKRPKNNQSIKR